MQGRLTTISLANSICRLQPEPDDDRLNPSARNENPATAAKKYPLRSEQGCQDIDGAQA
jgi:hypothetical protein